MHLPDLKLTTLAVHSKVQQLGDKAIWFILIVSDWVPNRYNPAARGGLIREN